jgi:hypothetical protein
MPRRNDVFVAFRDAIQLNPKGYMCLRTGDFIRELRKHNHHFTEQDANRWIELNQPASSIKRQISVKTVSGCYAIWGLSANANTRCDLRR